MLEKTPGYNKTCLNGYWDILPDFGDAGGDTVPRDGWTADTYMVPSTWTKPAQMARRKGETYYREVKRGEVGDGGDWEFLFDAYRYPLEWSRTRKGWMRRSVEIGPLDPSRRVFLLLEGVMPQYDLFVNDTKVCSHWDCALPLEVDVSSYLKPGANSIALYAFDHPFNQNNRHLTPVGTAFTTDNAGIWQDVYLIERSDVHLSDVTIRTSVRESTLTTLQEVHNSSDRQREIEVVSDVVEWSRDGEEREPVVKLPVEKMAIGPGQSRTRECSVTWKNPRLWSPQAPNLYLLRTSILENGQVVETTVERFGFREVWIDGYHLMLNGSPVHLFSDWGHKLAPFWLAENWVCKWFGMMRDNNMNHSRLHNAPHPRMYLDLADEEGIMITGESLVTGSGKRLASESPEFWDAVREHLRAFVRRDKNHPCVILWSYQNEMRWNEELSSGENLGGESDLLLKEPPKLQRMLRELDPTRIAYPDGDTTLWNEGKQAIISRHYAKTCSGLGWWDRKQPLVSSEMSWYHLMGPHNLLNLGGDALYADFHKVDDMAGLDTALVIEAGRTRGVAGFCPWNVSCISNLRMDKELVELSYDDFTTPGAKPLFVEPHSAEFDFWSEGKGYTPHRALARQAHAFRPFAVIDLVRNSQYYLGAWFGREVFVVNDTEKAVAGRLDVTMEKEGTVVHRRRWAIEIGRGMVESKVLALRLPETWDPGAYTYKAAFSADGATLDSWERTITVASRHAFDDVDASVLKNKRISLYKADYLAPVLESLGIPTTAIDDLGAQTLERTDVLVMGRNSVVSKVSQSAALKAYVGEGGRVILLEQEHTHFGSLPIEHMQVLTAFIRTSGHPAMDGFCDSDFADWGEDPYASMLSDSFVTRSMYRKDDLSAVVPLMDSGEGRWGDGGLFHTPLFELREGAGCLLACQLRVSEKLDVIPAAARLVARLIQYAATFEAQAPSTNVVVADGSKPAEIARAVENARAGGQSIVESLTPDMLGELNNAAGVSLAAKDVGEVYQAVRVNDDPVLNGVSNHDTCCIETFVYHPPSAENFRIDNMFPAPSKQMETLLATPTQSCLKELMVYGGSGERCLSHTVSRFLYDEKPQKAVVLGRIKVGSGVVYINQFAPPLDKRVRFSRLKNRLLGNLGVRTGATMFRDGGAVHAEGLSAGYPHQAHVLTSPVNGEEHADILRCGTFNGEGAPNKAVLNIDGWRIVACRDGVIAAESEKAFYVYYFVMSPINRIGPDYLPPDPGLLTNMACEGEGTVDVYVNGIAHGTCTLNGNRSLVEGIPLWQRYNQILLKWRPVSKNSTIRTTWFNSEGEPETQLRFVTMRGRGHYFEAGKLRKEW